MSQPRAASDPQFRESVQQQVEKLLLSTPYHSLQLPDGTVIPGLIGIPELEKRIASFPIPASLHGRRVLDVGAASGWNSFAMAYRGASVTAVDCVEFEELSALCHLTTPEIEYRILDVDELSSTELGTFDYVLFLGVLYHLRHPLLALERICSLTTETAYVESFVSDPVDAISDSCSLEFYETDELGGQIDNWHGPTARCLTAMCRAAGFVRVQLEYVTNRRAGVTCHRRWEPEPDTPAAEPPRLLSAVNNRTNDVTFHLGKDEYMCVYFSSAETGLVREDICIEVDGYGVNTLTLGHRKADEWQANSCLPPGTAAGPHWVRIRTRTSRFGNRFQIHMTDGRAALSATADPIDKAELRGLVPAIHGIENSLDGSTIFHGYRTERLCCRFAARCNGLPREAVRAVIDGHETAIAFLTDLGGGDWEASLVVPGDLTPGSHHLQLRIVDNEWSAQAGFAFMADRRTDF